MPFHIRWTENDQQKSAHEPTAREALKRAVEAEAAGHSHIMVTLPNGAALTSFELRALADIEDE
ncbi:hypothetical protein GCM10008171_05870 [Methylopila jiangsuensis]|uniref:Uncharacterized protein n=1 Tax=Methylopila jiangsuensis TaxID=586230 RepID=A0A9W6JFI3_9HYPH|nr:hypothetical protein [Methylopila jiangsuensis]MDR6285575.1 hypothetical protein [Methylopila jiangsuensis]GLK75333.1 hypothetical protein GCM10008171_05870 [Methylopila jiangsuensis]